MTFEGHFSLCCHSDVTSDISEIIGLCDTSTETVIANKKSRDSFQMIRLSMTLAIFQGH